MAMSWLRQSGSWILFTTCLACHEQPALEGAGDTASGHRNVVVVLLDTLRPDHLELYGYEHETAPFLASIGAHSMVFDAAFSTSSWTAPATASMLTALYPDRHGVQIGLTVAGTVEASEARPVRRLARRLPMLPEVFRQHGYRTFCVANNPNVHRGLGFGRGFDEFFPEDDFDAGQLFDVVRDWMSALDDDTPFLLYLHLNDVHSPYDERAAWSRGGGDDAPTVRYDSEIGYVDDELRRLFEEFGFLGRDVVVFLSDHGEEFGDHGGEGHSFQLYDELQRVLMTWHVPLPGFVPGRCSENASLVDVLPTLVDVLGWDPLPDLDGRSLAGALRGSPTSAADRPLFAHRASYGRSDDIYSVIVGEWKLIQRTDQAPELYHLGLDPGELENRSELEPARTERLSELLQDWLGRDSGPLGREVQVEIDDELERELRELGYVGDD